MDYSTYAVNKYAKAVIEPAPDLNGTFYVLVTIDPKHAQQINAYLFSGFEYLGWKRTTLADTQDGEHMYRFSKRGSSRYEGWMADDRAKYLYEALDLFRRLNIGPVKMYVW